jgi:hypothetical protein
MHNSLMLKTALRTSVLSLTLPFHNGMLVVKYWKVWHFAHTARECVFMSPSIIIHHFHK